VLRKNQISIAVEGRRLAILLERAGELDRARGVLELLAQHLPEERTIDHELAGILRRSGNTEELVERYLQRAELSVEQGNVSDAIPWLQEVLLLDRTRRDVARMIRDLRYQESERLVRNKRRNRMLGVLVLLSCAITAVAAREYNVSREFKTLPPSRPGDVASIQMRLAGLDDFITDKWVWMGLFDAVKQREKLRDEIVEIERKHKRTMEEEAETRQRLFEMVEAARMRGLRHVERDELEEGLADFKRALRMSTPEWEHRDRVVADIAALQQHLGKK
jgi:tetratricopeptide (TPR) repeat protein